MLSALYALAALAYIVWASHRLYVAWKKGYVTEVDDPEFGFETTQISRSAKPRVYWLSVSVIAFLLLAALLFLFFIGADMLSPHSLR